MKATAAHGQVHIGKVVRNALVFNFRNPRGGSVSDSALLDRFGGTFGA